MCIRDRHTQEIHVQQQQAAQVQRRDENRRIRYIECTDDAECLDTIHDDAKRGDKYEGIRGSRGVRLLDHPEPLQEGFFFFRFVKILSEICQILAKSS